MLSSRSQDRLFCALALLPALLLAPLPAGRAGRSMVPNHKKGPAESRA